MMCLFFSRGPSTRCARRASCQARIASVKARGIGVVVQRAALRGQATMRSLEMTPKHIIQFLIYIDIYTILHTIMYIYIYICK